MSGALLAVCTLPPWPVRDGYSLRVFNLLRELAPRWSITLLAPDGGGRVALGIADHVPLALQGHGLAYPWRFDGRPLRAAIDGLVRERRPDRALVWPGAEGAWFGRRDRPPAVMDMIDCNPLEFWRGALAGPTLRDRWRSLSQLGVSARYARRTVRSFSATACVGEEDAAWMTRLGGRNTVHVVPNGVALPPEADLVDEAASPILSFTGTLDYPPNIDAVRYAAAEIWPRVRQAVPGARFVVAGRRPVADVLALHGRDGIEVAADVPDMAAVLGQSWASIAPMRTGVGIKNKVLEAWAVARPVVLTPIATNGLVLPPGHDALVRTGADALAEAVIGLFGDAGRRRRLGLAARETVGRHLTWATAAARLDALLRAA